MPLDSPRPSPRSEIRLHKYLADCGVASRRACERLIDEGRVAVDGATVREMGIRIRPETQRIEVDGRPVHPPRRVHVLLYKPRGYLCTSSDPSGRPTFHALLPDFGIRLYSAGRLDFSSEGLLLVTNDGALAHRMIHPAAGHEKAYEVEVDALIPPGQIRRMCDGLAIEGRRHRAERVEFLGRGRRGPRYEVILRQGLNRQIRKMMAHIGRRVFRLCRTRLGPLTLDGLRPGEWRMLRESEVEGLSRGG